MVCFRLDATIDDGSLGRLCNDENKGPSAIIKVILSHETQLPHLCLFASREIEKGEEIRYNYGEGQKYAWRVGASIVYLG